MPPVAQWEPGERNLGRGVSDAGAIVHGAEDRLETWENGRARLILLLLLNVSHARLIRHSGHAVGAWEAKP